MKALLFIIFLVVFYVAGVSASDFSKKGDCPFVHESDHNCNRGLESECLLDFDCNKTMKCCRTGCHQYRCVQPLRNRVCYRNSDIAFVLDGSGSIGEKSFKNMKSVIKKLLASFPHENGYRHATVVYGEKPKMVFNNIDSWSGKNRKTDDLVNMVDKIPYYNSPMTRINAALRLVHQEVFPRYKDQAYRVKMIVLFTDGIQSTPPYQEGLIKAGKVLEKENIKVFAVITGEQKNMHALVNLCTTDQFIFEPEFLAEMIEVMNHETAYIC